MQVDWGKNAMIVATIVGFGKLQLRHLVLDYNGTLALDGALRTGVSDAMRLLSQAVRIHVLTGDTFGRARKQLAGLACTLKVLAPDDQALAKRKYVAELGPDQTVCVGNGRNDRFMLADAALGIAVVQEEGAAVEALMAAKIVCPSILSALELLMQPVRLAATLRS